MLPLATRLVVTAGIGGRFAEPVCDESQTLAPAPVASVLTQFRALRGARQQLNALAFDAGGLLAPNAVATYGARRAPDALAQMIEELGYDALTFGESELSAPRDPIVQAVSALRERGVPTIASNLRCDPEVASAARLCEVLVDADDGVPIVTRGQDRVALLTFISETAVAHVSPERAAGIRIAPLATSIGPAVRAARERGATIVLAIVDDGYGAEAAARALSLAAQLSDEDRPDLIIASNAGSELLFARPVTFRPAVAAAPPGGAAHIQIRRSPETQSLDVLVRPIDAVAQPDPAVSGWIERFGPTYCAAWGHDLPGAHLTEAMTRDGLLELTGKILRDQTQTEVALLNRGMLDASWAPMQEGVLRASDVHVALQYDDPLVTANVPGAWIRDVARRTPAHPDLLAMGIEITNPGATNESIKVNGRPLELRGRYQVVTLRFLAAGGDGLLPSGPTWEPVEGDHSTLRETVLAYLTEASDEDPRARVLDPRQQSEWTFRMDGDLNFGGSTVRNPGEYEDTQLQRQNTAALGLQLDLQANAQSPTYAWDNDLNMQYRLARTSESEGRYDEGSDQIRYRGTVRWRRFRVASANWYVPEPFVEGYVETELTVPAVRDFRHFLVRTTLGAQFTLTTLLSFKASAGVEVEALDPDRNALPGVGLLLKLAPWTVFRTTHQAVLTSFQADWFVSDLGGQNRRTLRGNFDLSVAFTDRFAIAMSMDLYGVRVGGGAFSFSSNITASARVGWLGRVVR